MFQRIDQAGYKLPIDERILADADTLMVFGLDHILSEQEASPEEITAIREWLKREGTCLLLAPHHDVGFTSDLKQRQQEYRHHRDPLVPRQQRFGQYTRSLMKGLGVPVHNTFGLRPAMVPGSNDIAPLSAFHDLDGLGLLKNVATLNFHPHLPHYALTAADGKAVQVLARQPIDLERPHPFTEAGNTEFNCLLRMPPHDQRAGELFSLTPPISPRCSAARPASKTSGEIWPRCADARYASCGQNADQAVRGSPSDGDMRRPQRWSG